MNSVTPENVLARIRSTEPEDRKKPVEHLIAELRQIDTALTEETAAFVARGVPAPFCKVAGIIANELDTCETAWENSRRGTPEQKQAWKVAYPEVTALRDEWLDRLETVLIDNSEAMNILDSIHEGEGPEDILLDISRLADTAQRYPLEAKAAGFSEDRIAELKEYAAIHAKTLALPGGSIPAKTARDRVRNFAELYLSRVRFHATRAFRNDEAKRAKFTSKYSAKQSAEYRARQKAKRAAEPAEQNP